MTVATDPVPDTSKGLENGDGGAFSAHIANDIEDARFAPPSSVSLAEGGRFAVLAAAAASILEEVRRAMERNRPEGARVAALRLVSLLTWPNEAESASARGGLAPWQQRKIDRYIKAHLQRRIPVDELAEQVSLSVGHFCRAFKETFGDSPHAYLMRLRLELAQELMLASDNPLTQIALASGFADQAHFSNFFRRAVGDTPSAWRRRHFKSSPEIISIPRKKELYK
jgi:AraC family transcriptional regulator